MRQLVQGRASSCQDEDSNERQDEHQVIQYQVGVAKQPGGLERQQAEHPQVYGAAAGNRE